MRKVDNLDELVDGRYYWLYSKAVNDNGKKSEVKLVERFNEAFEKSCFGNKIWATKDNNQAMEKFDIYGPIDEPNPIVIDTEVIYFDEFTLEGSYSPKKNHKLRSLAIKQPKHEKYCFRMVIDTISKC